jgi:hypothetical protein
MMWCVRWMRWLRVGWDGFGVFVFFLVCFFSFAVFLDLPEQGLNERGGICHGRASARGRVMVDDACLVW